MRGARVVMVVGLGVALTACIMNVECARPGQALVAHPGKVLLVTRISFVEDGHEFFPWNPAAAVGSVTDMLLDTAEDQARHVWLRRLDVTAASWELHPDADGSLAIWLPPGDYALLGSEGELEDGPRPAPTVVSLLRVPAEPSVVYAGELVFTQETREGLHPRFVFGSGHAQDESLAEARRKLEARYGALPDEPSMARWCTGAQVPSGDYNPAFVRQSRRLLDEGCPTSP
jgi:hypothetical protein